MLKMKMRDKCHNHFAFKVIIMTELNDATTLTFICPLDSRLDASPNTIILTTSRMKIVNYAPYPRNLYFRHILLMFILPTSLSHTLP